MWSIPQLSTPCEVVKTIWNIIVAAPGEELEHTKLLKQLSKALPGSSLELCGQHVNTALSDSLLVKSTKHRPKQKICTVYTLPEWQQYTFFEEQPDFWCYECHTTGDILKCEGCPRSFHDRCRKTFEEKQLELEQFVPKQKRITISSFGTGSPVPPRQSTVSPEACDEVNSTVVEILPPMSIAANGTLSTEPQIRYDDDVFILGEESAFLGSGIATVKHETFPEDNVKQEEDRKEPITITSMEEEPEFVGVVRPPNRRLEERLNTPSVKPEDSEIIESATQQQDNLDEIKRFCYACRLLKNSSNNAPPDVGKQELNYLLKFIIDQYKSWLPEDTYSLLKLRHGKVRQTPAWDRKTIEICKTLFLRQTKSIAYILKKISDEHYNTLDEFHVDLLDIAHNVAIIHGVSSLEYDAMMYFLADCVYDLFEIRQCPDCYRHSNEKVVPDFFARPCRTRHELVYAKQKSYQYWPAKVIRVVNNKYDVRFFGDKHLRALIDASYVKPIDTEPRALKINLKHRGFQLATEELLKHQALLDGPREAFAFGSINLEQPLATRIAAEAYTTPATFISDCFPAPRMLVAHRMKRGKQLHQNQTSQYIPSEAQSHLRSDMNVTIATTSTKARASKRQEPSPRNLEAKKSRNVTTMVASNHQTHMSSPIAVPYQQNNNTLNSNFNGHVTTPENIKRLPRTKQNLKQLFAEQSSPNKLKAILDNTNDPEEIKKAALKALLEMEERSQRKINLLKESHLRHISEIKKKQWCTICETESVLSCCWNISYCSSDCQRKHWPVHEGQHRAS